MERVLVVSLLALCAVTVGTALECYQCDHVEGCQDGFKTDATGVSKVTCPPEAKSCEKVTIPGYKTTPEGEPCTNCIKRGCSTAVNSNQFVGCRPTEAGAIERCYCRDNNCNGADKQVMTVTSLALLGGFAVLLRL